MVELGREVRGGVSKADGEVAHVLNVSFERVHVLIRGVGVWRMLLLLGFSLFFFYFIIFFGYFLLG